MIPSRGLRWSTQAIASGRRRIEAFSTRQFSGAHYGSVSPSPVFSKSLRSISRPYTGPPFLKPSTLIRCATVRFASTSQILESSHSATDRSAENAPSNFSDDSIQSSAEALLHAPEHIGYLKSLGLEWGYGPTSMMEFLMEHIHVYSGAPWWGTIVIAACVTRFLLFKSYIDAAENSTKVAVVQPITKPLMEKMQAAQMSGDMTAFWQLKNEQAIIYKRAGIKMWKNFVPMIQIVFGFGTFRLLTAMAKLPVPGLEDGGILWFYNLAVPDPLYILPVLTAGIMHWVMKKGGESGVQTMTPTVMNIMKWGFPAISLIFTSWLPAACQLAFLTSSLLSWGQSALLRRPMVRTYFKMTPLPNLGTAKPESNKLTRMTLSPVLSQEELSKRFQVPSKRKKRVVSSHITNLTPPTDSVAEKKGRLNQIIAGAIQEIKSTASGIKEAGKGVFTVAADKQRESIKKREFKEREAYEKKRAEEVKREKWLLESQRRAIREQRKLEARGH